MAQRVVLSKPVKVQVFSTCEELEMWQSLVEIKAFIVHEDADWTVQQVADEIEKLGTPNAVTEENVNVEGNPVINCLHGARNRNSPRCFGVTLELEKVQSAVPIVMTVDAAF